MIRMNVRGMDALQKKLKEIPHGTKRIAVQAFTDYIIGDDNHGLKHYPPYTTQTVRERTFKLKQGWTRQGDEYKPIIVNYVEYAPYVPPRWKKYNWREWLDVVKANTTGAIRHAQSLVNKYLKAWK